MRKRISVNGQDIIEDIEQKIELLKYQYDLIIIDTFVEMKMNWNARLSQLADTTIFIVESSYFGNIKARQLWEENKFLLDRKKQNYYLIIIRNIIYIKRDSCKILEDSPF